MTASKSKRYQDAAKRGAMSVSDRLVVTASEPTGNGCGRWAFDLSVQHRNGGSGTVSVELSWHHRCYPTAKSKDVPAIVVKAVLEALEAEAETEAFEPYAGKGAA